MLETVETDTLIIGAGIVGLAICYELSKNNNREIVVLEKHNSFCVETSSRNSEVIHAGIYYPVHSLKSKYCLEGKSLLYNFCKKYSIPYKNCGKYIVASSAEQNDTLNEIKNRAENNSVVLKDLDSSFLKTNIKLAHFHSALWSKDTGIIDSHALAKTFIHLFEQSNNILLYRNQFVKLLEKSDKFISLLIQDYTGKNYIIKCKNFINTGGLSSAKIAQEFHPNENYKIKPCLGRYFSLSTKYKNYFENLIYPLPDPKGGLGLHVTFDLDGNHRLGPDVDWTQANIHEPDNHDLYKFPEMDLKLKEDFLIAGRKLIPGLNLHEIHPDYIGVRPKLFIDDSLFEDFMLLKENCGDTKNIHLLGIESPGLTSCLAFAVEVKKLINNNE